MEVFLIAGGRKYGISRSNLANKIYIKKMDIVEAVDYLRREC